VKTKIFASETHSFSRWRNTHSRLQQITRLETGLGKEREHPKAGGHVIGEIDHLTL
jgi:hypothetical protein